MLLVIKTSHRSCRVRCHLLWGQLDVFVQAKAPSALANWNLFGIAKFVFLAGFVPAPLSMPCPWGEKKADSPGPAQYSAVLEGCLFEIHLSLSLG